MKILFNLTIQNYHIKIGKVIEEIFLGDQSYDSMMTKIKWNINL